MPTERQLKFLEDLIAEKNISNEDLRALLKQYNARTLEDLDTKQASELIDNLKKFKKVDEREKMGFYDIIKGFEKLVKRIENLEERVSRLEGKKNF